MKREEKIAILKDIIDCEIVHPQVRKVRTTMVRDLVIKISEEDYEIMKHNIAANNPLCPLRQEDMVAIIANGALLPKGHGRLKDVDRFPVSEIEGTRYNYACGENEIYSEEVVYLDDILSAETVIEADEEETGK